jgi:hypothetical protein
MDEAGAALCALQRRAAQLCYEMALYHGEDNCLDQQDLSGTRIGLWLIHSIDLMIRLPPRMRAFTHVENRAIEMRAMRSRKAWEAHLRVECELLGIPFIQCGKPRKTFELRAVLTKRQVRDFLGETTIG